MYRMVIPPLDSNDDSAKAALGTKYNDGTTGYQYMYVKVEDLDVEAGDLVEFSDTTGYNVTKDRSESIGRVPAGVATCDIDAGNYGWILVDGKVDALKCDSAAAVTAGAPLIPHATTDGTVGMANAATGSDDTEAQRCGFALEAQTAGNTVAAIIRC